MSTMTRLAARCIHDRLKVANAVLERDNDHICVFDVEFPQGTESLAVRLGGVAANHDHLIYPLRIFGAVVAIGSRDWDSLDAYFEFEGNYQIVGLCTIGPFPEVD